MCSIHSYNCIAIAIRNCNYLLYSISTLSLIYKGIGFPTRESTSSPLFEHKTTQETDEMEDLEVKMEASEPQQTVRTPEPGLQDVFDRIKTHFPPAKVKKIMQTDEDIGKVSQATPVIAGRSLEFFIALLVKRSSEVARQLGCKRISGEVMKETILTDEKFDFLRENVCGEAADQGQEDQEQDSPQED